jgi:hypothetical protein
VVEKPQRGLKGVDTLTGWPTEETVREICH